MGAGGSSGHGVVPAVGDPHRYNSYKKCAVGRQKTFGNRAVSGRWGAVHAMGSVGTEERWPGAARCAQQHDRCWAVLLDTAVLNASGFTCWFPHLPGS